LFTNCSKHAPEASLGLATVFATGLLCSIRFPL
jgi:hypothetical protein